MLSQLVALGVLTTTGSTSTRLFHLRTKPGAFGHVVWFHPDSEYGAMICGAIPPSPPPRVRKPAVPRAPNAQHPTSNVERPVTARSEPREADAGTPPVSVSAKAERAIRSTGSGQVGAAPQAGKPALPGHTAPLPAPVAEAPTPAASKRPRAALSPQFAKLFASSAPGVISSACNRSRCELYLQSDAAIEGLTPPQIEAYLPAALAQLDVLTVDDAARCGVTAAEFAAWRRVYPAIG
jgi:hypothetical protein